LNTQFEPLERRTKEGKRQTSVNNHRYQEHPPDIAMIFIELLVGGVFHKPASPSAARQATTGKEY
jgi:hypothetical protein